MVRRRNQLTEVSASDSDTNAYHEGKKENKVGNEVKADEPVDAVEEDIFLDEITDEELNT